jgi:hypothetical protein
MKTKKNTSKEKVVNHLFKAIEELKNAKIVILNELKQEHLSDLNSIDITISDIRYVINEHFSRFAILEDNNYKQ